MSNCHSKSCISLYPPPKQCGFHFFHTCLNIMKMQVLAVQSCLILCDPIDCSLRWSSIHGILQARILECVSISFSRGSSQHRNWTWVSCIAGRLFTIWATREAPLNVINNKILPMLELWQRRSGAQWGGHWAEPGLAGSPSTRLYAATFWYSQTTVSRVIINETGFPTSQFIFHHTSHAIHWYYIPRTFSLKQLLKSFLGEGRRDGRRKTHYSFKWCF